MKQTRISIAAALFLVLVFIASSARTITPDTVIGRYEAMSFRADVAGLNVDLSCLGGSFRLDLTADQVIGGQVTLPDTLSLPPLFMTYPGTYALEGDEVILRPRNTDFARDSRWRFLAGGILQGEFVHQGIRFRAEFQRQ